MGSRVHVHRALLVAVTVAASIPVMGPALAQESTTVCPPVTLADIEAEAAEADEQAPTGGLGVVDPDEEPAPTSSTTIPEPECDTPFVYPMVFPLLGGSGIGSPFGAARDGGARLHAGNDLFGPHLQPVVAAASGTVTRIGPDEGISGYRVGITHDDGWSSLYIHLNNDTAGTDDSRGVGIRQDLRIGDRVEAGQVIGWNGDSGNAEGTPHHLHFELRDPSGTPVDPQASLEAARRTTEALGDDAADVDGPFLDAPSDDALAGMLSRGIPVWCDEAGIRACPDTPVTAPEVATWLAFVLDPPPPPHLEDAPRPEAPPAATYFPDVFCDGETCDDPPALTRLDLARVVVWDMLHAAFGASPSYHADPDTPDSSWTTPTPIPPDHPATLTAARVIEVLGNTDLCPVIDDSRPLTRAEAADFLLWDVWSQCPTSGFTTDANR